MSRIDNQIEHVKTMTDRVNRLSDQIERHASSLGFFNPPAPPTVGLTGVVSNLSDAHSGLDNALSRLAAAVDLFS